MKTYAHPLIFGICLSLVCSGCISFTPSKQTKKPAFMVVAERTETEPAADETLKTCFIRVLRFRTAELYDSRHMLVVDAASGQVETLKSGDFAVAPGTTTSESLRRWLAQSGRFGGVVDSAARVEGPTTTLDGWVEKACVEKGSDGQLTFRLDLTIWCQSSSRNSAASSTNFMQTASVPLNSTEPAAIAEAFGTALKTLFTAFEPWLATAMKP